MYPKRGFHRQVSRAQEVSSRGEGAHRIIPGRIRKDSSYWCAIWLSPALSSVSQPGPRVGSEPGGHRIAGGRVTQHNCRVGATHHDCTVAATHHDCRVGATRSMPRVCVGWFHPLLSSAPRWKTLANDEQRQATSPFNRSSRVCKLPQ
jgi:hypothetical protein